MVAEWYDRGLVITNFLFLTKPHGIRSRCDSRLPTTGV